MTTISATINPAQAKRTRVIFGVVLIVTGLFIYLLFGLTTPAGLQTTYGINLAGSQAIPVPDLVLPSQLTINLMAGIAVFFGAFQLARGVKSTGSLIGVIAATFVVAFLTWAAQDKSFNLTGMLSSSLVRATPIALAALCGVISERAAVINIGIEGIMLVSAQVAVVVASLTRNLYVGLIAAILVGGLIAAFHAFLVIRFKVDQIVSGVAINIFGAGLTSFISSRFVEKNTEL